MAKLEGKRPLGRPRHWWVENIIINYREMGLDRGLDWLG